MHDQGKLFGAVSAILFAASVGHVLRLLELGWTWSGPGRELMGRDYVALSAVVLYGVAAVFVWLEQRWVLWVAAVGPVMGLLSVTLLPEAAVDAFQIVLGLMQAAGVVGAVWLLVQDSE